MPIQIPADTMLRVNTNPDGSLTLHFDRKRPLDPETTPIEAPETADADVTAVADQRGADCHSAAVSVAVPQQFRSSSAAVPQQLRSSSAAAPQQLRSCSAAAPQQLCSRSVLPPPSFSVTSAAQTKRPHHHRHRLVGTVEGASTTTATVASESLAARTPRRTRKVTR